MYVRDARKNEEVWLLDQLETFDKDSASFRSRDFVIALDDATDAKAAFGRLRLHGDTEDDDGFCELTSLLVRREWEHSLAGEIVIDELVERAANHGFDQVYAFAEEDATVLTDGGFEVAKDAPHQDRLEQKVEDLEDADVDDFVTYRLDFDPDEYTSETDEEGEEEITEEEIDQLADELGIDRDNHTYKYDTGN